MKYHSTTEDQRGWYKEHGKPRNRLNKGGTDRKGTLGYRLTAGTPQTRFIRNGRIIETGTVSPPAPPSKRSKMGQGEDNVETWASKNAPTTPDGPTPTTYHLDGQEYATWAEWNEAVAAKG